MTPEAGYLSGVPGLGRHGPAKKLIFEAWSKYSSKNENMKPVPTDPIPQWGGKEPTSGGLKLRVAYRDLPRGENQRPSSARFNNPYNLGWYDFSASEAKAFQTDSKEGVKIPEPVFRKFATLTLKDAVRGQCSQFKPQDLKEGSLTTKLVSKSDGRSTYRLSGTAKLDDGQRSFDAKLHGLVAMEDSKFVRFDLVAAGQRTGKSGANGRETDLGPAPMGVAYQLYDGS